MSAQTASISPFAHRRRLRFRRALRRRYRVLRLLLIVFLGYLVLSAAAGMFLAEMSAHLPKARLSRAPEVRARINRQFGVHVRDVAITAEDGALLQAWFIRAPKPNGRSVILLHGIAGDRIDVSGYADIFLKQGYDVLLPDSRAHGDSGGSIATYGVLERDDVHLWVLWLRVQAPGCTYLLGESMGAAIGLQAAAVAPELCAVAVEDPFARFREIAYYRVSWATHLPRWAVSTIGSPAVEVAILYTWLRYGVSLHAASPLQAVRYSHVPALLMTGTEDHNIPRVHAEEIAHACGSRCQLWVVSGADHGGISGITGAEFGRRILAWFQAHDTVPHQVASR